MPICWLPTNDSFWMPSLAQNRQLRATSPSTDMQRLLISPAFSFPSLLCSAGGVGSPLMFVSEILSDPD